MFKKVSPVFVVVSILMLVLSSLMFSTVSAQEGGTLDPNTPISNVGGIMSFPEGIVTSSDPFTGTGKLAPESAQVTNPKTAANSVESASPESVIGTDNRTQVTPTTAYPNRAIVYLYVTWKNNSAGSCTGWLIGPRTVVTAGHCVYNYAPGTTAHGWAKSIRVFAGRNGASVPYGETGGRKFFSVTGWTGSGNPSFDYGAIQITAAVGNTVGWFGWRSITGNSFPGYYIVRGYPGDKPSATMWTMTGTITNATAYRQWYSIDTFGGQSGSPLYASYQNVCCYGYGVHTYGTSVSPYFGNSATRISAVVSNNLANWKAFPYP